MSSITVSGVGKNFGGKEILRDVRQLEEAVESLSGRLAATGSTATPAQLVEMMDRYGEALTALEEADRAWLATQRALLASSA